MYTYALLEPGCYYLVQEKINSPISLIKATVESDVCMFITRYDEPMVTEWKKKNDPIHDILECLTDDTTREWEKYYNSEDAYYEEDDE
ncbi:MAG: hypothetical protein GC171_02470 [Terrimonas sp.]|nr:hypothetical protein [Terrimonas sp.]